MRAQNTSGSRDYKVATGYPFSPLCANVSAVKYCEPERSALYLSMPCTCPCHVPLDYPSPLNSGMDSPIPKHEDVVYRASHFCRHDFWEFVDGARFSIAPYTGLGEGVRVMLHTPEVCERVKEEIMCTDCTDRWKRSNVKAAFAGVVWKSSIVPTPTMSPYELSLIEAFKTAALYGFMDGVMWLLAVRLLDVVIHGGCAMCTNKLWCKCFLFFSAPLT